jgi:putative oxidoreductase
MHVVHPFVSKLIPAPEALPRWALAPLRFVIGYGFFAHGLAKWNRGPANFGKLLLQLGVPLPTATAWMVTVLEIFGGIAIFVGALVAVVSIPLIVSMLVAMVAVHWRYGFSAIKTIGLTTDGPVFGPPGIEVNLLYLGGLLALLVAGPGAFSIDGWLANRRPRAAEPLAAVRC